MSSHGKKSQETPYEQTFLKARSMKSEEQLRSTSPIVHNSAFIDARQSSSVISMGFVSLYFSLLTSTILVTLTAFSSQCVNRGIELVVTPSVLQDGQDAFVTITSSSGITGGPQDYISLSCGESNGFNDFLDAIYVQYPPAAPITNVSLAP